MKRFIFLFTILSTLLYTLHAAADTVWYDAQTSRPVTYRIDGVCDPVVTTAASMFESDMEAVTGHKAIGGDRDATVCVTQLDGIESTAKASLANSGVPVEQLDTLIDGYDIRVVDDRILITGSNGRGAAYGLLELSRMAGVDPWIWWGDAVPAHKDRLTLPDGFASTSGAQVEWRGVFVNDEDWSLRPWSIANYEPEVPDGIGPRTYARLFELLLRLRGNVIWPGMHPGTRAFFLTPEAKETADRYGVAIGTSHCEPLLRNNVGEWDAKRRGPFNYRTNRDSVHAYWAERLHQVKGSAGGNIFTIGMRGIHDSSMEGYSTMTEKLQGLQEVIDNQQQLISEYIGDPTRQTQVFVPYKEVLELYESGLRVPDYVTLMWCDDNYGYLTRLSTPEEQLRKGGAGIYYHLSYWGRPHDYLWLTSTQPGLIYHQLREALDHNVRKLWIANVHDPKVAGYDLELFMDMAWQGDSIGNVGSHYRDWLSRRFGDEVAADIYPYMREFYRLVAMRRPEFMGWSQTELDKRIYPRGLSPVADPQWTAGEAQAYLYDFSAIANAVTAASGKVAPRLADSYFATILYPVLASEANACKHIHASRARNATDSTKREQEFNLATLAYGEVQSLTERYNSLSAGKWRGLMDAHPRDLPAYRAPSLADSVTPAVVREVVLSDLASKGSLPEGAMRYDMLGYSLDAVKIPPHCIAAYEMDVPVDADYNLEIGVVPTHPIEGGRLRVAVSVDGGAPVVTDLREPFRSEPWKQNVLRCQARISVPVSLNEGPHTFKVKPLDEAVTLDIWELVMN